MAWNSVSEDLTDNLLISKPHREQSNLQTVRVDHFSTKQEKGQNQLTDRNKFLRLPLVSNVDDIEMEEH